MGSCQIFRKSIGILILEAYLKISYSKTNSMFLALQYICKSGSSFISMTYGVGGKVEGKGDRGVKAW